MTVAAAAVPVMFMAPAIGSAQPSTVCTAEGLSAETQQDAAPGNQHTLHIVLTNTSTEACLVQGYPGLDLTGPEDPNGTVYTLPRQETGFAPVTVEPGAAATADLTYLAGGTDGWIPNTIVLTPPDTTTQLVIDWPDGAGSVERQDGATHPGTFIGPLRPA
ncbi:hypothetical protein GCM10023318_34120 [Nocardia callitridis]|uniref:DUF4232 domain-containing protein n=2 Tax=Nocardia callitridis TaxID=648753 RepID=A0ABP9KH83_9NOCA